MERIVMPDCQGGLDFVPPVLFPPDEERGALSFGVRGGRFYAGLLALVCWLVWIPILHAADYVNDELIAWMGSEEKGLNLTASGTADNPNTYLLTDGYVLSSKSTDGFGWLIAGDSSDYNIFTIENGASLFYCFNLGVGSGGGNHNMVIVSDTAIGDGSDGGAVSGNGYDYVGGKWIYIGQSGGSYNTLLVRDGAKLLGGGLSLFGYQNSLIVTGAGSGIKLNDVVGNYVQMSGNYGSVIVSDGATLYAGSEVNTGYTLDSIASHNSVTVSGNSILTASSVIIANTSSLLVSETSTVAADVLSVSNGSTAVFTGQSTLTTSSGTGGVTVSGHSSLTIEDGSTAVFKGGLDVTNSTVLISGAGSKLATGSAASGVFTGSQITVSGGATLSIAPAILSVSQTVLKVSGAGSLLTSTVSSLNASSSQVIISDGAKAQLEKAYWTASASSIVVNGEGSSLMTYRVTLKMDSTVTLEEGGLLALSRTNASSLSIEAGSFLQICSGYLAWKGNHVTDLDSLISSGRFQVLDLNGNWVTITDLNAYKLTYADLAGEAGAFTDGLYGDDTLLGYTILTADVVSVPEPSTICFLIFAGVTLLLCRKRRVAKQGFDSEVVI